MKVPNVGIKCSQHGNKLFGGSNLAPRPPCQDPAPKRGGEPREQCQERPKLGRGAERAIDTSGGVRGRTPELPSHLRGGVSEAGVGR